MGLTQEEFEKLNLNEVVKAADKFLFEVQNTLLPTRFACYWSKLDSN